MPGPRARHRRVSFGFGSDPGAGPALELDDAHTDGEEHRLGAVAGFLLGVGFLWVSLGDHPAQASLGSLQGSATVMAVRSVQANAYRARLPLLDPVTRARVERDLTAIRQAESDLADALKATPDNAALARLYESTLRQEFDFYDTIVRATEPANSGTTI